MFLSESKWLFRLIFDIWKRPALVGFIKRLVCYKILITWQWFFVLLCRGLLVWVCQLVVTAKMARCYPTRDNGIRVLGFKCEEPEVPIWGLAWKHALCKSLTGHITANSVFFILYFFIMYYTLGFSCCSQSEATLELPSWGLIIHSKYSLETCTLQVKAPFIS